MYRSDEKGKIQFAKLRQKQNVKPHFALAKTLGVWTPVPQVAGTAQHQTPIAQIDCSSKEIHLGPPGPSPADVLVTLPLNSVVKVLQWKGDFPQGSGVPNTWGQLETGVLPHPRQGDGFPQRVGWCGRNTKQISSVATAETKMGPTTMTLSRAYLSWAYSPLPVIRTCPSPLTGASRDWAGRARCCQKAGNFHGIQKSSKAKSPALQPLWASQPRLT